MKFAKYYNVKNKVNEMINEGKLSAYQKDHYKGLFVCMDTNRFLICRVLEGYDKNYKKVDGAWLIEQNEISQYNFINYIKSKLKLNTNANDRTERDFVLERLSLREIIESILIMDDFDGLENSDTLECKNYKECLDVIDDGFGIIEFTDEIQFEHKITCMQN